MICTIYGDSPRKFRFGTRDVLDGIERMHGGNCEEERLVDYATVGVWFCNALFKNVSQFATYKTSGRERQIHLSSLTEFPWDSRNCAWSPYLTEMLKTLTEFHWYFFFCKKKHAFGVKPRVFWCESESWLSQGTEFSTIGSELRLRKQHTGVFGSPEDGTTWRTSTTQWRHHVVVVITSLDDQDSSNFTCSTWQLSLCVGYAIWRN